MVILVTSAHKIKGLWYRMLLGRRVWPSFSTHDIPLVWNSTTKVYFCQNSYFSCVLVAVDDDDNDNDNDDDDVHDERCL